CSAPLVASAALLNNCCLCTHGLFWMLRLSLRQLQRAIQARLPCHTRPDTTATSPRTSAAAAPCPPPSTLLAGVHCYLCSSDNLKLSDVVLKMPVFIPLSKSASIVRCVEPSPSVSESLDLILDGAQNLVALIGSIGRKMLAVVDFCWLA
ncbi:hypothetical protein B296_00049054, partial [Ensete ventricosum]